MGLMERPVVTELSDGGKCWEHEYDLFSLKVYVPETEIDGQVNNYTFRAPLLLVFEENQKSMEEAVAFAKESRLADIASKVDSSVLFVYPTKGGWADQSEELYVSLISEIKMTQYYSDGITEVHNFFTKTFDGYFARGAIFRADIYSYGASADYVAKNLLKTIQGEYLWGPGEITPAMCSMERLGVVPAPERKDIAILSVGNSEEINAGFAGCENLLVKDVAEYQADFKAFVRKFKMWCGKIDIEPDFEAMDMTEEAGGIEVATSSDHHGAYVGQPSHTIGYFAYYNNDAFKEGPAPMVVGFHGGGDSSMYLTFVAEWYRIAHKYGFLFVSVENHQNVTATEAAEFVGKLKEKYNVDPARIYGTGFSMGSCKCWEIYMAHPETFAGIMPASALLPMSDRSLYCSDIPDGKLNLNVSVPVFYSGGEDSHLPELACQAPTCLERTQYVAKVNNLKTRFDVSYEDKANWPDPVWGIAGDRIEKFYDESKGSPLTVHYFDSEDGVCRTAFGSVSGQIHECRHHSCEQAWKFVSQFSLGTFLS